ncbi:glycosyltransferase family 4 protein [Leptolyngbya sp. DQ-M1]|uniref:glycosyltransferase family 4 protein n=1 Tax=Leptolyngbya sp. DQ-M1 TaxID=2933920 RepID=UPI003299A97A
MTKKIVLVMTSPPIPFGKADSHWYYVLLKELVDRGHQVSAFVACETPQEIERTQALFPGYDLQCYLFRPPQGLLGKWQSFRRPYSYMFDLAFRQALTKRLAEPYDVLQLEGLWSGWLGLDQPEKTVVSVHYLFCEDGTFESSAWKTKLQGWISYSAERYLLKSLPRFITLSDRLADRIHQIHPDAITHIIPLGFDLSHSPFNEDRPQESPPIVGLIGNFGWKPTHSAAERLLTRLWTEIKAQVPSARLQIVGRAAKTRFAAFESLPDLSIHQDVANIAPYFQQIDVLLYAPTAGSGMKVKVLESFAFGTSVVTTPEGVEGLPAKDGIHAGIAIDDRGLIERTVALLNDPMRRETQRHNARQLLEQVCSPTVTVTQVEQVYDAIIEANS